MLYSNTAVRFEAATNQGRRTIEKKKKKKKRKRKIKHLEKPQRKTKQSNKYSTLPFRSLIPSLKPIITQTRHRAFLLGLFVLSYLSLSMSTFYQVMGAATKCQKIKKHPGVKLKPLSPGVKEPFQPDDAILHTCETTGEKQTIKCQADGTWTPIAPPCPDPSNNTCPDLGPLLHGSYAPTGPRPYKFNTIVAFRCENEILPNGMHFPPLNISQSRYQPFPTTNNPTIVSETTQSLLQANISNITTKISENINNSTASNELPLRYNLTGYRTLKCLASGQWNHPMPTCTPVLPEQPSNIGFLLASIAIILIPILIMITVFHLFMRWRKRQQQRERWKQYFTDYKYRHSKTSITFKMRPNSQATIPVTDL